MYFEILVSKNISIGNVIPDNKFLKNIKISKMNVY